MMIFFTLMFITFYLATLLKGNLFYDSFKDIKDVNNMDKKTQAKVIGVVFGIVVPMFITEIIYLIKALSIDTLKYPTILMILNIIVHMIIIKNKPQEMKKRTFKGTIVQLLNVTYFGYMFYLLVF